MSAATATDVLTYEARLDRDREWAMSEGFRHFQQDSEVHHALHRICNRLNELEIPYAVVGGMALFLHGFRRFTEDVDLLVTRDDLQRVHQQLSGLGYLEPFEGSKHLKDVADGVKIEFLVTGDYPGDGKPKPVAFPDPNDVVELRDGMRLIVLPALVELKLASGMTSAGRLKDLADVQELIKTLNLPADFATQLNPYVRAKFQELWEGAQTDRN